MKTTEVSKDLIGRRCECIFTGMMVTGVIEDAPFAAAGGQTGLSDDGSSFRRTNQPNRPQRF